MGTVRLHPALLALAAFIVLVAASCRAPQENGVFVRCTEKDVLGAYRFTVDLGDSLHSHALYFYTVIDARAGKGGTGLIRLQIDAVSPSGRRFSEMAGIDSGCYRYGSPFSRQYESLYRSGFDPVEHGQWELIVKVLNEEDFPGFRGLGLKHEKL